MRSQPVPLRAVGFAALVVVGDLKGRVAWVFDEADYDIDRIAQRISKGRFKASAALVLVMVVLAVGLGAWLENIAGNLRKVVEVHAAAVRDQAARTRTALRARLPT